MSWVGSMIHLWLCRMPPSYALNWARVGSRAFSLCLPSSLHSWGNGYLKWLNGIQVVSDPRSTLTSIAISLPVNLQVISVMISVLPSLSVSVSALPLLLGRLYSSLPLLVNASHTKVLVNCSPVVLGGCTGLERSAFILTTVLHGPVTLGGCAGPGRNSVTMRMAILCGFPPCPHPTPGFLEVDLCCLLPLPPSPCPLPLLNCLLLNLHCLCCGLSGEGKQPDDLSLLPELLHCWAQWFFLSQLLQVVPYAGHSLWLWEHLHLPQVLLGGPFWKVFDKVLVCNRRLEQLLGVPLSELACVFGILGRLFHGPLPPQSFCHT